MGRQCPRDVAGSRPAERLGATRRGAAGRRDDAQRRQVGAASEVTVGGGGRPGETEDRQEMAAVGGGYGSD